MNEAGFAPAFGVVLASQTTAWGEASVANSSNVRGSVSKVMGRP